MVDLPRDRAAGGGAREGGLSARDTPAAVVYHATWPDQKIVRGTVGGYRSESPGSRDRTFGVPYIGDIVEPVHTG